MFLLCSLAGLYNSWRVGIDLSGNTAFYIALLASIFIVTSAFVGSERATAARSDGDENGGLRLELVAFEMRSGIAVAGSLLGMLTVLFVYRDVSATFGLLGVSGNWNDSIAAYRNTSAYGGGFSDGEGMSDVSGILLKLLAVVAFVFLCIAINNFMVRKDKRELLLLCLPAICYMICWVLQGVRIGAIRIVCAAAVTAWVLWLKKSGRLRQVRLSTFIKVCTIFAVSALAFWGFAWFVGRQVNSSVLDYLCDYIGCSFVAFDSYIQLPNAQPDRFGAYTFLGIYNFIGQRLGIDEFIMSGIYEFRSWHGYSLGNVYTVFRPWCADFGIGGAAIVSFLSALLYSKLYQKAKNSTECGVSTALVCYAFLSYGVFAMPLASLLTQSLFTVTTPFTLMCFWLLIRYLENSQKRDAANGERSGWYLR